MDCFIESELWVHKFFNGVVNCRARANGADPFPPLSIVLQLERDADPWQQDVWFNMDVRSYHCQCRLLDNDTYPSKEKRTIAPWFLLKSTFGFSMDGEPASINFTLFLVYTLLLEIFGAWACALKLLKANKLNQEWRHTNSLQKMVLFRFGAQVTCTYIELVGEEDQKRFSIMLFLIRFIFIFT